MSQIIGFSFIALLGGAQTWVRHLSRNILRWVEVYGHQHRFEQVPGACKLARNHFTPSQLDETGVPSRGKAGVSFHRERPHRELEVRLKLRD